MGIIKTVEKEKVQFLMDFDYNNVLGRLKFVLGKDASFFADVRVRKNDVTWSTKDDIKFKPFCEAIEIEQKDIKKAVNYRIANFSNKITKDALIGDFVQQITTYPSDQYIFYTQIDGEYEIILTGWGCKDMLELSKIQNDSKNEAGHSDSMSKKKEANTSFPQHLAKDIEKESTTPLRNNSNKIDGGFFFDNKNTSKKSASKQSKIGIFKSIVLVLLAAMIALIIPIFLTGIINRLVADLTHQWYLSGTSRVLITIFVAITTYFVAYILIRFTTLRKSIVFNVVCFVLTFVWAILMGLAWIPGFLD